MIEPVDPPCELCGARRLFVIYAGLPGRLCENEDCNALEGLATYPAQLYFTGFFLQYDGTWRGLFTAWWRFLFGDLDEE
jgi:hypothetical protein